MEFKLKPEPHYNVYRDMYQTTDEISVDTPININSIPPGKVSTINPLINPNDYSIPKELSSYKRADN